MSALDYYLVHPGGLLVEEFALAGDLTADRLHSAMWTPHGGWRPANELAQSVRRDPERRALLSAVDRRGAEVEFRRLGGIGWPEETLLRKHFDDGIILPVSAPLRLHPGPAVHRVLFAGELDPHGIEQLRKLLRLGDNPDSPGVVGSGALRVNDTNFRWDLRRIGPATAWSIDISASTDDGDSLRWLLRQLTFTARRQGLIPALIDRLA